jgi:hypothetical protein
MWATCPRSASSGYHADFHECYQKHANPLNCRISSSDISVYHADFHEGHGAVGEWLGNDMDVTWAQHGMCELAFTLQGDTSNTFRLVTSRTKKGFCFGWLTNLKF